MDNAALQQTYESIWVPNAGPQTALITCPVFEVFFGGARGGGKTSGMLGEWLNHAQAYGRDAAALMVRRERTQLIDTIEESKKLYGLLGATYNETDKLWRMANGARFQFAYLESDSDAEAYQGRQNCVAVGTRIRMADGEHRRIDTLRAGEWVATLEGAKRIIAVERAYRAPCVRVLVRDASGSVTGEQVHPVWHPVLTSGGLIWSRRSLRRRIGELCRRMKVFARSACEAPDRGTDQGTPAWYAFAGGERSGCKASWHSRRDGLLLERQIVPVVLHERCRQSGEAFWRNGRSESTVSGVDQVSFSLSLVIRQATKYFLTGLRRTRGLLRSAQDRLNHGFSTALACAARASHVPQGFLDDYRAAQNFDDARARSWTGNGLFGTPSQDGVAQPSRDAPLDGLGTTPTRSRFQPSHSVHPYTGEARRLTEAVTVGTMEVVGFEDAWVMDLCVDGANHYISDTGLVNKNTRVYVEEMPNFPRPDPIMKLKATLRSVKGVPTGFRATGNPGGSGHTWVKQRYIDPAPGGYKIITDESGLERVFIPSRVQDNAALALADPGYVARLRASGSEELVRAWLEGDWNVVQGAFFGEWSSAKHVVEPHELPKAWVRYRCMDWGSAAPFAVYWVAVSDGSLPQYPRGALVFYREWYGVAVAKDGTWKANVGLKLTAEEVAQGILERTPADEKIDMGVLDPAAFANHGGPSIAERMMAVTLGRRRVQFHRADNTRVGVRGAMSGWDGIRGRLKGDDDGRPMMYFFSTCVHAIRTLPALQHDMMRPEDVDTDGEDHAGDAIRYGCAARPWVRASVKAEPPPRLRGSTSMTINEIIAKRRRERLEADG